MNFAKAVPIIAFNSSPLKKRTRVPLALEKDSSKKDSKTRSKSYSDAESTFPLAELSTAQDGCQSNLSNSGGESEKNSPQEKSIFNFSNSCLDKQFSKENDPEE